MYFGIYVLKYIFGVEYIFFS